MSRRRPGRFDALAVLGGERDYWRGRGRECCAKALEQAIGVMSKGMEPSGPSCSADPPQGSAKPAECLADMMGEPCR